MQITTLRAFTDNYIFMLSDDSGSEAAAVDPGDAKPHPSPRLHIFHHLLIGAELLTLGEGAPLVDRIFNNDGVEVISGLAGIRGFHLSSPTLCGAQ